MGTEASPIPGSVKATLVLAPNLGGMIVNDGGKFTAQGAYKPTSTQATSDTLTGAASMVLYSNLGTPWAVGDEIVIGKTSPEHSNERRTITSVSQVVNTMIVGLSSPLEYDHTSSYTYGDLDGNEYTLNNIPVYVENLSRNVVIRSAGTDIRSNSSYIVNYSQVPSGFVANYTEFAFLGRDDGRGGTFPFLGISFQGSSGSPKKIPTGSISHSTIRDGFYGLVTSLGSGSTFQGNAICFNRYGVDVSLSSQNTIFQNRVFSNGVFGIRLAESINNTLSQNAVYDNEKGIELLVTGSADRIGVKENTLVSNAVFANGYGGGIKLGSVDSVLDTFLVNNKIFLNLGAGLDVGASYDGTFVSNYSYANIGGDVSIKNSNKDTWIGGAIGFSDTGLSAPSPSSGELMLGDGSRTDLNLKGVRINSARQNPDYLTPNQAESILSYNQNAETGTLRLWGTYAVSGSTLSLESGSRLYLAEILPPRLMRGVGHSISASPSPPFAASQLITLQRSGGRWNVKGTISGFLGSFSGSILNQSFPAIRPQFILSFSEGPSPQEGDELQFVLVGKSEDVGRQKKLLFGFSYDPTSGVYVSSKLLINPDGGFKLAGSLMDKLTPDTPNYTFIDNGALTLDHAQVLNADEQGLQLSGSGGVDISFSTFDFSGAPAPSSNVSTYITARDLVSQATLNNVVFNNSGSFSPGTILCNIRVLGNDSGLTWMMKNSLGLRAGEAYDDDPHDKVQWDDTPIPPDTQPPTISIVSPVSGASVSGDILVYVSTADNVGVVDWSLQVNGEVRYGSTSNYIPLYTSSLDGSVTLVAIARDAAGNTGQSAPVTIKVDNIPPLLSQIRSYILRDYDPTITWSSNEPSDSQVEYGLTTSYGSSTNLDPSLVIQHSVALTDLEPSTLYHFRVKSKDAAGQLRISSDYTFTTLSALGDDMGLVGLVRSEGLNNSRLAVSIPRDGSGPRAIMVSQRRGMDQQLVFGLQVKEAKITDLTGREISHVTQNGNEPLVISLQGNSGLRVETGINLIQMKVCPESNLGVCKWRGRALIVVR
ncbi:MAG: right-handed parallel beta-helix repeat-containing protein [Elusimicrobia bacterium]|nr:right-handed parallel beta-helix repeat-containing protein [Elusimicrobiota bacterium]